MKFVKGLVLTSFWGIPLAVALGTLPATLHAQLRIDPLIPPATMRMADAALLPAPLAFAAQDTGGDLEIFISSANGELATITNNDVQDYAARWSPDGSRLAFSGQVNGDYELQVINADGSGLIRLTLMSGLKYDISWSPDGSRIAFVSNQGGNSEIYSVNSDGSSLNNISNNPARDLSPTWSPDGAQIAFLSERDGEAQKGVYIMDASGTDVVRLTNASSYDAAVDWSPDGARLAITSNQGTGYELFLIDRDGANQTQIVGLPGQEIGPRWSPDGSRLTFHADGGGDWEVFVVNSDGSNLTNITDNAACDDLWPTWSPDGTYLAYASNCGGLSGAYVRPAAGGPQVLLYEAARVDPPEWRPVSDGPPPPPPLPTSHLVCEASASPTIARAEEQTAHIGDIYLQCVSSDPGLPGPGPSVTTDVRVRMNNSLGITNNVNFGAGSRMVDAVLIVNGNDCLTPASSGGSFACGADYQDPQYGEDGAVSISWNSVLLPFPGETNAQSGLPNPDVTSVRMTSIRADVAEVSTPRLAVEGTEISVFLTVAPSELIELPPTLQLPVATVQKSIYFDAATYISGTNCAGSPGGRMAVARIRVREGFASAFKIQGSPSFLPDAATESGYFAPGSNNGGGASRSTPIRVGLYGYYAYGPRPNLTVPTTVDNGQGLVLTIAGKQCFAGGTEQIGIGDDGVVYQVCASDPDKVEQIEIPITAEWTPEVEIGTASVLVGYPALKSNVNGGAGLSSHEPRFWPPLDDGEYLEGPKGFLGIGACRSLSSELLVDREVYGTDSELYVLPREPGGPLPLTNNTDHDGHARWSPDGSRIAFGTQVERGSADIYVMNADRSGLLNLTNSSWNDYDPSWSPDGSRIVFRSRRDGNYEIYVMNPNGSGQTRLTNSVGDELGPAWQADGSKITFFVKESGKYNIYVMDADGGNVKLLQPGSSIFPELDWSPDGSKILFQGNGTGSSEVYVMSADGSNLTNLTTNLAADRFPTWSPDGTKIAFDSDRGGNSQIYVMNADGSQPYKFSNVLGENVRLPRWSPDGSELAFQGNSGVYVQGVLGGEAVVVFKNGGGPQWRPQPGITPPPPPDEEKELYLTKLGVYNDGRWLKDDNGDGILDDEVESTFGFKGAMPLVGDWDGDGKQEIAVYANIFGSGLWFRDLNGNGAWDEDVDQLSLLGWGNPDAKPVVGDWNGDGRAKIGVYSNGLWLLDYDGNGALNGNDKVFELGGWRGSVPLVGDWNGDGRDSAGIYVPGHFVLDYNADHHFENGPEDRVYQFGISGSNVAPIVGDWSGDGKAKVGIFRAGQWSLDLNGDGQSNGSGESLFFYGPKEASPVIGDWAGIGKDSIGAVDDGAWYLDINGDFVHDGLDPILFWGDEGENRVFIPGKWQGPAE